MLHDSTDVGPIWDEAEYDVDQIRKKLGRERDAVIQEREELKSKLSWAELEKSQLQSRLTLVQKVEG